MKDRPTNHTKVLKKNLTLLKIFKHGGIFDYFSSEDEENGWRKPKYEQKRFL